MDSPELKIKQIAVTGHENTCATQSNVTVVVLCEDNSLWTCQPYNNDRWIKIPEIPQNTGKDKE